jgi:hypothetical protein
MSGKILQDPLDWHLCGDVTADSPHGENLARPLYEGRRRNAPNHHRKKA